MDWYAGKLLPMG